MRVVYLRTAANPNSRTIQDTVDAMVGMAGITRDQASAAIAAGRLLPHSPHTADTAQAVALLGSDRSRMMTGTVLNSSAGVVPD